MDTHEAKNLKGEVIKEIFSYAEEVADLHSTLTSPRGEYFRRKLLQLLSDGLSRAEIEELGQEFGLAESARHLHKFEAYGLIEPNPSEGQEGFTRTIQGEEAINIVRELERKVGEDKAKKMFEQALGKNSIRLFLKVYGSDKAPTGKDIIYTPLEIGQISAFLPRTVEGIAAIDKLDSAGLVSYLDDGNIHVNPRRSTAFYYYLKALFQLLLKTPMESRVQLRKNKS